MAGVGKGGGSGAMAAARCARCNRWSDGRGSLHALCFVPLLLRFLEVNSLYRGYKTKSMASTAFRYFGKFIDRETEIVIYCREMYAVYDHVN